MPVSGNHANLLRAHFMQDLLANSKCSLLVARDPEDRTDLVITLHGDAINVSCIVYCTSFYCWLSCLSPELVNVSCQLCRSLKKIGKVSVLHICQSIQMLSG